MDLGLKGKSALVTGASKGIGLAVAECLAGEGMDLVLVARDDTKLSQAQEKIASRFAVNVRRFALDLSRGESARRLARECGSIDVLVNNAGAIPRGSIAEIDEERWRQAWDLKVFGYINMTREFYAPMKARRSGTIINVIGAGGERADAQYIAGSTANAALMMFTRALGGRSADDGVRVVGINPGAVATDRIVTLLRKEASERFGDPERWAELVEKMPFGRAARPEEIAAMVAFLASDLSAYTTGAIMTVDGGLVHRVT